MDADALNMSRLSTWDFQRDFYPLPPRERSAGEITGIVARHSPTVFTFKRRARRHPTTGKTNCLVMVSNLTSVRQLPEALLAFSCALNVNIRPEDVRTLRCGVEGKLMGCHCWPRRRGRIDLKGFLETMNQRQPRMMFLVRPSLNHQEGSLSMVIGNGVRITLRENGWYRIEYNSNPRAMLQAFHWLLDEVNNYLELTYPPYETIA